MSWSVPCEMVFEEERRLNLSCWGESTQRTWIDKSSPHHLADSLSTVSWLWLSPCKSITFYTDTSVSDRWTNIWPVVVSYWVIVVVVSILSHLLMNIWNNCILLTIQSNFYTYSISESSCWSLHLNCGIIVRLRENNHSLESDSDVTHSVLVKVLAKERNCSTSLLWPAIWSDAAQSWLDVIVELNGSLADIKSTINGDLEVVEVHVWSQNGVMLLVKEHGRVAVH